MSVYSLCQFYIEGSEMMQIYDLSSSETVFEGSFDEAKFSEYGSYDVMSFGIENDKLVINIDSSDE